MQIIIITKNTLKSRDLWKCKNSENIWIQNNSCPPCFSTFECARSTAAKTS